MAVETSIDDHGRSVVWDTETGEAISVDGVRVQTTADSGLTAWIVATAYGVAIGFVLGFIFKGCIL